MNLGYIIRTLREARNWSQDQLAHEAQTTAATVSRIENSKQDTTVELAGKLAAAFQMPAYELIAMAEGYERVSEPLSVPEEGQLVDAYRRMDKNKQQAVLQLMEWLKR
ncbi:helix-turn-helix transcriptional regulator [Chitinimonas lacunae]|uniref:Helix-turn-helix transcriptional regulator n=1 Tax=Chitinimonas lacunae TaxID=1963018 RepID=A0ABV8MLD2_9NEIS